MLGASTSSGNATRLSVSVPASQGALVCLLKVLCNGEANTDDCSPDQVIQYMDLLLHRMCCFYIECVAVCIFRKSLAHSGEVGASPNLAPNLI